MFIQAPPSTCIPGCVLTQKVDPSNVKLDSPLIVAVPVAVNTLLFALFVIVVVPLVPEEPLEP